MIVSFHYRRMFFHSLLGWWITTDFFTFSYLPVKVTGSSGTVTFVDLRLPTTQRKAFCLQRVLSNRPIAIAYKLSADARRCAIENIMRSRRNFNWEVLNRGVWRSETLKVALFGTRRRGIPTVSRHSRMFGILENFEISENFKNSNLVLELFAEYDHNFASSILQ